MLLGLPLDEVITQTNRSRMSWSKLIETLDYYGIAHQPKPIRPTATLPYCCIVYSDGGFVLYYDGKFRGTTKAIEIITSVLEIICQ